MPHKDPIARKLYVRKYNAAWCKRNRDKVNLAKRKHYHKHRDEILSKRRNNPTELARMRAYYYKTKDRQFDLYLQRIYGIDLIEYTRMLQAQKGVCQICKSMPSTHKLAVDHCHVSGKNRGLLCLHCNCGLGNARHSIPILRSMITYLEKYNGPPFTSI